MLGHPASIKLSVALVWTTATLIAGSAFAQSQAPTPGSPQKEVAHAQGTRSSPSEVRASEPEPSTPENEVAAQGSRPSDRLTEVAPAQAENAAIRDLLRKSEAEQKALREQVDRLQRRLDGVTTAGAQPTGAPPFADAGELSPSHASAQAPPANAENATAQPASVEPEKEDRYRDGVIIYENPKNAKVPFLLKFNDDTQVRYLNTTNSDRTFTDHLGVVREVHTRNDITVNRSMFNFSGYMFDPKLQYSLKVWTSAGAASIVVTGNIGWRFNKGLTVTGGYTGVPGSRSLVNTFPFFQPTDRTMADNFFRPGFTQGAWASGEPLQGLNYLVFLGNGLNTLNISAAKIDQNLVLSGSVWWEPLGPYSEPGKSRNMYDDYFASAKTRIRIGTALTRSREDRFSETDKTTPDNTSIYNSDGVLAFETGAFAPGVTVDLITYRMWAIDGGLKLNGFSINGQYYFRWLNDFAADGPLPLDSTFDHGFELSAGYFVLPKTLMPYVRGSQASGEFANPYEYAGGLKWYPLDTERFWLTGELMRVHRSPYTGAFTPYTAGMNGWVPMFQTVLAF